MNYDEMIESYQSKLQRASDEMLDLIEYADNYEEELECSEEKENIDINSLEWGNAKDARAFDILKHEIWMYERIIAHLGEMKSAGDDKAKIHRLMKANEVLIQSVRKNKNESKEFVELEQQFTNEADSVLDLLDELRGKEQ